MGAAPLVAIGAFVALCVFIFHFSNSTKPKDEAARHTETNAFALIAIVLVILGVAILAIASNS